MFTISNALDERVYKNVVQTLQTVETSIISTYKKFLDHLNGIHSHHHATGNKYDLEKKARGMKVWKMPYIKANSPSTVSIKI